MVYPDLPGSIEEGSDFFRSLHLLSLDLASCPTLKDLYREAVRRGRDLLDIDRMAILLYDPVRSELTGTFGTDEQGAVVDESDFRAPVEPDNPFVRETLSARHQVAIWEDMDLTHRDHKVGRGWNGMGTLWDGDRPFGWLAVDNLIRHQPLRGLQKELLGLYGSVVSGLILRKRHEQELVDKVVATTNELQTHMVELERLASLGGLVAGVYHDINTPLGNAVLATSAMETGVNQIREALGNRTLGQRRMEEFLGEMALTARIVNENLGRAKTLIENFKRLAVNQSSDDTLRSVNLRETIEAVTISFSPQLRQKKVELILEVPPDLVLVSFPGVLGQILSNLISNSLVHAFGRVGDPRPLLIVRAGPLGDSGNPGRVFLDVRDNGRGVDPAVRDSLYQPYVTTKRDQGGSGLGLSIVRSLVVDRLGGTIEHYLPDGGGAGFRLVLSSLPL